MGFDVTSLLDDSGVPIVGGDPGVEHVVRGPDHVLNLMADDLASVVENKKCAGAPS